jgi:hypothetical protein
MNHSNTRNVKDSETVRGARPPLQLPDFTALAGPDGEIVLVPRFMVPLAELQIEGARKTADMPFDMAKHGVSSQFSLHYFSDIWLWGQPRRLPVYDSSVVAEGRLYADPEPVS